jgi:hypothetical protein
VPHAGGRVEAVRGQGLAAVLQEELQIKSGFVTFVPFVVDHIISGSFLDLTTKIAKVTKGSARKPKRWRGPLS